MGKTANCHDIFNFVNFFTKVGIMWRTLPGRCIMAKPIRPFSFTKSAKSLQENATRAGPAASASYTLIGAIVLLGGIGYAVDAWQGTAPWGLFVGLLLGIVVGFYELVKTIWGK